MKTLAIISIMLLSLIACNKHSENMKNPFLSDYNTPFEVPPFNLIDTTHYIPAFEKGMAEEEIDIEKIINNQKPATFNNTIIPLDKSGQLLSKVAKVFFNLNSSNTNAAMQSISREISPLLTQHNDNKSLNKELFQRVKSVYESRNNENLDDQQIRVTEKLYDDFVRNGANLSKEEKEKLRDFNQKLSLNQLNFRENILAETNTNFKLVIDKEADLAGLHKETIEAAAQMATDLEMSGKWVFTLQKPSMIPFLQYAENRELREKLYRGYFMRGNNNNEFDNKEIIANIVKLRVERSNLLGYESYADYIICNNMAKTPEKVYEFLSDIMKPALKTAKKDLIAMQKIIDKEGGNFKLDLWDWWYYAEKLRKEKYDLDEAELKPYFALNNIRDGMFYTANKLYGLSFTPLPDLPVYHPDVEAFEVKETDGSHVAVLYLDYYPRTSKRVGAWCSGFRSQSYENGQKIFPITTINCNFTPPNGDDPALLTWDEVLTLFHEFGHALHGFFSDGQYKRTAGKIPKDMIELPSQIMENWAAEPDVLKIYAKHYITNEPMPQELLNRLQKSMTFNQGFMKVEYVAASILDLDLHSLTETKDIDVINFEKESMERLNLMKEIIPRYRTTYFNHIIGSYAAGYYVYLWANILDADAFQAFVDSGDIFNKKIAASFRKHILTDGGTNEGMVQYNKFRGKEPSIKPFLKKVGLDQ